MPNPKARLLAILVLPLPLAAQTDTIRLASVEGLVTNSVTGDPVPRAHVTLQGSVNGRLGEYSATSAEDGKFSIAGLTPGSYMLTADRVGFTRRGRTPLMLNSADTRTGIEIKLTPTGAISGRVTDADGEPVEGASVEAEGGGVTEESRRTDDQGRFRLGGLAPGRYRVRASLNEPWGGRPEIRTDGTVEVHNAATYYPSALAKKGAGTILVRPAAETDGVDIQLIRVPFVRVSGRVVGMPPTAEHANVSVFQGTGGLGFSLKPDGSFELWRLDPGAYTLSAEWNTPGGAHVETAGTEIEVAGSNIDNLELRVVANSNVPGQLEFEDESVKQSIQRELPGAMGELFQISSAASNQSFQVAKDGAFRLEDVAPGKYWLGLADDKAYVKSMRLGSMSIDGAVLDLRNGSGGTDLILLVAAATGSISGTVQDDHGNPVAARVVLTEAGEETGFDARQATAGVDGVYTIANLPPGNYQLVAIRETDPAIVDNDVLGYENSMENVTVPSGEKVRKDLTLRLPEDR